MYSFRQSKDVPLPLAEQELIIPSWRENITPVQGRTHNSSETVNRDFSSLQYIPSSPRTIWDPPHEGPSSLLTQDKETLSAKKHFSFLPKTETKPGAIKPARVTIGHWPSCTSDKEVKEDQHGKSNYKSLSMHRNQPEWPECYNSFHKLQGQNSTFSKSKESIPLKSCLKANFRSNSLPRTFKTKWKHSTDESSSPRQNVNFKQNRKYISIPYHII